MPPLILPLTHSVRWEEGPCPPSVLPCQKPISCPALKREACNPNKHKPVNSPGHNKRQSRQDDQDRQHQPAWPTVTETSIPKSARPQRIVASEPAFELLKPPALIV